MTGARQAKACVTMAGDKESPSSRSEWDKTELQDRKNSAKTLLTFSLLVSEDF